MKQLPSEAECRAEPSYKHLHDVASGKVQGGSRRRSPWTRSAATAMGRKRRSTIIATAATCYSQCLRHWATTSTLASAGERGGACAHERTTRQGVQHPDEVWRRDLLDGGVVPHQVKRVIPRTAPGWWATEKVPNGARCVCGLVPREGARLLPEPDGEEVVACARVARRTTCPSTSHRSLSHSVLAGTF